MDGKYIWESKVERRVVAVEIDRINEISVYFEGYGLKYNYKNGIGVKV